MPGDFVWLENHQFRRYGSWKPGGGKLQRGDLGRKIPGLYAFVVDGLVQYIGKAETHLRGRVRNYNRCLIDNPLRPHRDAHGGIARAAQRRKDGRRLHSNRNGWRQCLSARNDLDTRVESRVE